ncbi:MAG: sulfite exporter TauE/SafE family protein [Paracoccaceae bacterium]|nr:sulfite exporter TauE/SafE family protein [Paracoccaceae bacterium]MDE2913208.1 sulfite exporter TauE/SafE family protein [Paracoccaceae bacterium]
MTGFIAPALALEGLPLLLIAVTAAGLVRGFAGFGTALVYVPLASLVMPPVWVLTTVMIFDVLGILPLAPRSVKDGRMSEVAVLMAGALVGLPAGVFLLTRFDTETFRTLICGLALLMLVVLASGWRLRKALGTSAKAGVGVVAGALGGVTGAPGPPVILFYLSGPERPAMIRANNMIFLLLFEFSFLLFMAAIGYLQAVPVAVGLVLTVPYAIAGWIGQAIFDPDRERLYRFVAYLVIAVSAIVGLPLLD